MPLLPFCILYICPWIRIYPLSTKISISPHIATSCLDLYHTTHLTAYFASYLSIYITSYVTLHISHVIFTLIVHITPIYSQFSQFSHCFLYMFAYPSLYLPLWAYSHLDVLHHAHRYVSRDGHPYTYLSVYSSNIAILLCSFICTSLWASRWLPLNGCPYHHVYVSFSIVCIIFLMFLLPAHRQVWGGHITTFITIPHPDCYRTPVRLHILSSLLILSSLVISQLVLLSHLVIISYHYCYSHFSRIWYLTSYLISYISRPISTSCSLLLVTCLSMSCISAHTYASILYPCSIHISCLSSTLITCSVLSRPISLHIITSCHHFLTSRSIPLHVPISHIISYVASFISSCLYFIVHFISHSSSHIISLMHTSRHIPISYLVSSFTSHRT